MPELGNRGGVSNEVEAEIEFEVHPKRVYGLSVGIYFFASEVIRITVYERLMDPQPIVLALLCIERLSLYD